MTRLSSIFSFETFRLRPWFPKATIAALLLLAGAEVAARHAVKTQKLHVDPSGRQLLADHRNAIKRNQGDIWLLGNSTLGYGVDEKLLATRTGTHLLKLPHGSATVGASAKLLNYYLDLAPHPPREVVVFVTKDDLNLNGYRAAVSAEYETLCKDPMRKPQEFLMLWQARSHIADRIEETVQRVLHHGKKVKLAPAKDPFFDGKIAPDDEMYTRLIKNFQMDPTAIANVADAAHRHGVKNVAIVLVPCTDVYARFHDKLVPQQPYAKLRSDIADQCASAGIKFYDFGDPSTAYREFYDGYHLNDAGAARFTVKLADSHVLVAPTATDAARPSSTATDSTSDHAGAHADAGSGD
jgi:hypothetical protein